MADPVLDAKAQKRKNKKDKKKANAESKATKEEVKEDAPTGAEEVVATKESTQLQQSEIDDGWEIVKSKTRKDYPNKVKED